MRKNNKKEINVLVDEGFSNQYLDFLNKIFNVNKVMTFSDYLNNKIIDKIDLILYTGGEDIDPTMYNENKGAYTHINKKRDEVAYKIFNSFPYTPKLGICRGSQFLCVANGGKLVQHVNNHTVSHRCHYKSHDEFIEFEISSTHHQMMYPFNLNKNKYEILAWSKKFRSDIYLDGNDEEIKKPSIFLESEIVYFKKYNSLAIQGHPEFNGIQNKTIQIIRNIIDENLIKL